MSFCIIKDVIDGLDGPGSSLTVYSVYRDYDWEAAFVSRLDAESYVLFCKSRETESTLTDEAILCGHFDRPGELLKRIVSEEELRVAGHFDRPGSSLALDSLLREIMAREG